MNVYDEIKKDCEEVGITVHALCLEAKVDRQIIQRWSKEDPKSIKIYKQIKDKLKELKELKAVSDASELEDEINS
jgi:hypothetical protein